jgi:hypothetical protein
MTDNCATRLLFANATAASNLFSAQQNRLFAVPGRARCGKKIIF